MGGRKWPLLLVLTALGTGGRAYRDTRSAEVIPVWDDEHQHDMSNMQRGVEEETPVPECPHSCDSHAVLDKDSQEVCKLKETLSPGCSDLSGLIVFLDQTNTEQNFTVSEDGRLNVYLKESMFGRYELVYKCSSANESRHTFKNIAVGEPPLDVENLKCTSVNWERLDCSWKQPYNPTQCKEYAAYLYNRKWQCNDGQDHCSATPDKGYRPEDPYFPLIFETNNKLGDARFTHSVDNWAAMLPNSPEDVVAKEKSPLKILVSWASPSPLKDFPPGLVYRLNTWGIDPPTSSMTTVGKYSNSSTWEVEIDVPHAWVTYGIELKIRSGRRDVVADWDDGWSSKAVSRRVEIKPAAPWAAPEVGNGTYQVIRKEDPRLIDLWVAWQHLPRLQHNGPGLRYLITCSSSSKTVNTTESQATFPDLPIGSYRVTIQAENTEGVSNVTSEINISRDSPAAPGLSVVVFHRDTGQYELRWDAENGYTYTVYICVNSDSAVGCKGDLYWKSVGKVSAVNITLQEMNISQSATKLHFALSAENKERISSGMSWDTCLDPQDYDSKPKPPIITIDDTSENLILSGSVSCTDRTGVVEKVETSWGPTQHDCNANVSNATEIPKHLLEYNTNYTICLRLVYRSGPSDWTTTLYMIEKDPFPIWIIGLLASASVLVVIGLVVMGQLLVRHLNKTHKALTRELNMPSVLGTEGDDATQFEKRASHEDGESKYISPGEVNIVTETTLHPVEGKVHLYGTDATKRTNQHERIPKGYVLAHIVSATEPE